MCDDFYVCVFCLLPLCWRGIDRVGMVALHPTPRCLRKNPGNAPCCVASRHLGPPLVYCGTTMSFRQGEGQGGGRNKTNQGPRAVLRGGLSESLELASSSSPPSLSSGFTFDHFLIVVVAATGDKKRPMVLLCVSGCTRPGTLTRRLLAQTSMSISAEARPSTNFSRMCCGILSCGTHVCCSDGCKSPTRSLEFAAASGFHFFAVVLCILHHLTLIYMVICYCVCECTLSNVPCYVWYTTLLDADACLQLFPPHCRSTSFDPCLG